MRVTVVQVRAGCELRDLPTGEVIVTALTSDGGQKIEWRTVERPAVGSSFNVTIDVTP